MCIVCQTAAVGATFLAGVLPVDFGSVESKREPAPAVAMPSRSVPTRAGTACTSIGATTKVKKQSLTCKMVGKRLIWTKTAAPAQTTTTTAPTTSTTVPSSTSGGFAPDAMCADKETSRTQFWEVSAGFPKFTRRIPSSGTVRVLMLPVDFPDAVASGSPATDMLPITRAISDVYGNLSNGALSFDFTTLPSYLRVSNESTWWGMESYGTGRGDSYVADIVRELDPQVNFSGVDVVVVMAPPTIRSNQVAYSPAMPYPETSPLVTAEKSIYSSTMTGADAWANPMTIVHEFGHLLGWVDTYVLPFPSGPYEDGHQFTGKWDFMGYAWTKGLFGWHQFWQGWLEDAEVLCVNSTGDVTTTLAPLGATTKTSELLLLRGSSGNLVGVEVRRPGTMDEFVSAATQGVLVYTIDADLLTGKGPIRVQGLSLSRSDYLATAPLKPGQSLTVDGWTITVSSSNSSGDTIRATR